MSSGPARQLPAGNCSGRFAGQNCSGFADLPLKSCREEPGQIRQSLGLSHTSRHPRQADPTSSTVALCCQDGANVLKGCQRLHGGEASWLCSPALVGFCCNCSILRFPVPRNERRKKNLNPVVFIHCKMLRNASSWAASCGFMPSLQVENYKGVRRT